MSTNTARDVHVLNGPNLNMLGFRQPHIYGTHTYDDLVRVCHDAAEQLGVSVSVRQTNAEHELIEWLHTAASRGVPVVLNAAAWTHTSVAVADACAMLTAPLCELHMSNVYQRESFRHTSLIAPYAHGVICGWGVSGYALAIRAVSDAAEKREADTA